MEPHFARMIAECDILTKENTNPNGNNAGTSDDSYSGASFPWFQSQNRRKSQLGKHPKERKERIRVLQDIFNDDAPDRFEPLTLNDESEADGPGTFPSESVVEAQRIPTFQPLVEDSPFADNFELPPMHLPFSSFEPTFNIPSPLSTFETPSPSPHSTPTEAFESMCSFSAPSKELKSSCLSSHFPKDNIQSNFKISSPAKDTETSKSQLSTPARKVVLSHEASIESGFFSDHEFKIPNTSPTPANTKIFVPARVSPRISNQKPFNVVAECNDSILKSSLKKPTSTVNEEKIVAVNQPLPKAEKSSPRKEVRFAEPTPLPRSTTKKPSRDLSPITVKGKEYRVISILGVGGSCVVYEAEDPDDKERYAIKRVELPEDEEVSYVAEGFLEEVKMLEKLQSSNDVIIKMYDHELVHDKKGCRVLYVVLEKGEVDLSKYMRNTSKEDKLIDILFCWKKMLRAVSKIHDEDVIHLDLKPANFLFVKSKLKLIDFGIASAMPGDKTSIYLSATSGTMNYTSPETLSLAHIPDGSKAFRISKKSDVWSLGCILYRWIYGHVPFHTSLNKWQRLQDILSLDKKVEFPERADVPEPLVRTLQSCLEKDPKKRPTVKELLQLKLEISLDQCMS